MTKKKALLLLVFVVIVSGFSIGYCFPQYVNRAADFIESKIKINIPDLPESSFKLGLDLQGGVHLLYEADLSGVDKGEYANTMQRLRDRIERRVGNQELAGALGVQEVAIQTQESAGNHRLIVELPGIKDPQKAIELIGETPFLEFKSERPAEESEAIINKMQELEGKSIEEIQQVDNWELALEDPYFVSTSLTGKYLKNASVIFSQNTSRPMISLQFDDEGAKIFADLTKNNVGKRLAIYVDQTLVSAPTVEEEITGGQAQITGSFDIASAKKLAAALNEGALPVPINLVSQQLVGPTLGQDSFDKVLGAGLIGFAAIFLFLLIFYRLPGILACIALVINASLLLLLFKLSSVTLTLSGIAGFVLSVGMAVDANILIFARMKEEFSAGRNFQESVREGFSRAWPSIWDSNITTLITSVILFGFGTTFVKGFASTLIIGMITSMFSAIVITKSFLILFENTKLAEIKWLWK